MRRYLLAAVAAAAIASPAAARDNAWYAGIEGGLMIVEDPKFDYRDEEDRFDDILKIDHKIGYDVDLIGGYDFGSFRIEGESAYKRASIDGGQSDQFEIDPDTDVDGSVSVLSAMANALVDFGDDNSWNGYFGGGLGIGRVKQKFSESGEGDFSAADSALAWQLIAGFRAPVAQNIDLGLKYRFFNTGRLKYGGDSGFSGDDFELSTKFRSHSLLASLIFNFAPPPPPPPVVIAPPPPPMAPATQTCPDGTVILATEVCPLPPPPPPPPPAGERG